MRIRWKCGYCIFANTTEHWAISGKTQTNQVKYYNLDVIISLWYRVNLTNNSF